MADQIMDNFSDLIPKDTAHIQQLLQQLQVDVETREEKAEKRHDAEEVAALKNDDDLIQKLRKKVAEQGKKLDIYRIALTANKSESAETTAKAEFNRLTTNYLDRIREYDVQDRLMDQENDKISNLDIELSQQEEKLNKMENAISVQNRSLYYTNNEFNRKNRLTWLIRNSAIFWLCLIILFIFYKVFSFYKDSIMRAIRRQLKKT